MVSGVEEETNVGKAVLSVSNTVGALVNIPVGALMSRAAYQGQEGDQTQLERKGCPGTVRIHVEFPPQPGRGVPTYHPAGHWAEPYGEIGNAVMNEKQDGVGRLLELRVQWEIVMHINNVRQRYSQDTADTFCQLHTFAVATKNSGAPDGDRRVT